MRPFTFLVACLVVLCAGCTQSQKLAQQAYDRGTGVNEQIRGAFFTKAWGLNRALVTESRRAWVNDATIAILEGAAEGKIDTGKAREIVKRLETELGKDEAVCSQNFAYLAFLLTMGERADGMLGNVDFYLESQKPIWAQVGPQVRGSAEDMATELKAWEPLLQDLRAALPPSLIQRLNGLAGVAADPEPNQAPQN